MPRRALNRHNTGSLHHHCSQRDQLLAAFHLTARIYSEALGLWHRRSATGDAIAWRQAEIIRQDAWIEFQIARLELLKHTEWHRCEPAN